MDPEQVGPGDEAAHEAGDRARVAFDRLGQAEDLPDHGLPGNGQEHGQVVALEPLEVAVDREVVVTLLREVDARIEDDLVVAQADAADPRQTIVEKAFHRLPHIG